VKNVIVLGASSDRAKYSNQAVRAFLRAGYRVFPVNLREVHIEECACFPSVASIPERPQIVSVYLPPAKVLALLPEIALKGCDELWLNPGTVSSEVLRRAEALKLTVVQTCSIIAVGGRPVHPE